MKLRIAALLVCAWTAAFAAPVAIAAPACTDPGGIGGTGVRADGGTGGTGARADDGGTGGTGIRADGGIGGTGMRADTDLGLIGVITGFGSICVNGVEVHYEAATPVTVNGQQASTDALALGQTVAVRAAGGGAEPRARSIAVLDAVVGPVTAVERSTGTVQVLGQRVQLAPSTVLGPGLTRESSGQARVGDSLRVSGLRTADGAVVATRIERAPSGVALAYGPLSRDAAGAPRIGGLLIDMRGSELPRSAGADEALLVSGRARDGKLVVERVVGDPHSAALAPGRFIVQGYVTELRGDRELRAGGVRFSIDAELGARLARDRLVRVSGRSGADGIRVVERVEFLAEPMNPRPQGEAGRAASRGGSDDRRGRGDSGADDRRGSGGGDSGGRSGPSDRVDRSGPDRPDRLDRPDRPDSRGRH